MHRRGLTAEGRSRRELVRPRRWKSSSRGSRSRLSLPSCGCRSGRCSGGGGRRAWPGVEGAGRPVPAGRGPSGGTGPGAGRRARRCGLGGPAVDAGPGPGPDRPQVRRPVHRPGDLVSPRLGSRTSGTAIRANRRTALLTALGEETLSRAELAARTGLNDPTVRRWLTIMRDEGSVELVGSSPRSTSARYRRARQDSLFPHDDSERG
jgi:DNA-binding transcriptional ArsR family regulator